LIWIANLFRRHEPRATSHAPQPGTTNQEPPTINHPCHGWAGTHVQVVDQLLPWWQTASNDGRTRNRRSHRSVPERHRHRRCYRQADRDAAARRGAAAGIRTASEGSKALPAQSFPRYAGNSKREWRIGETTDDTERTIAVARAIMSEQRVCHVAIGREMLACTKAVHPGVRSLWEFHQAGDPARIATRHDGCGAAVRVAPVGIFFRHRHVF
jgi:hypothetical protein